MPALTYSTEPSFLSLPTAILSVHLRRRLNCHGSRAAAVVCFRSDNLIVVVTKGHTGALPGVEEGAHIDSAACAVLLADGPVLLEGLNSINRRRVGTRAFIQIIGGAVHGNRAAGLGGRALQYVRRKMLGFERERKLTGLYSP